MRNYSLLEDIYLGDIEKIQSQKGQKEITLSECLFAAECYNLSPDQLNFDIAKIMFDGYIEKNHSKGDIEDLINATKNISKNAENFIYTIDNEYIKKFIAENKLGNGDFIDETLRLDSIILKDKSKIEALIEVETFKKVLKDAIPLEQAGEIINVAKQSADMIIGKSQKLGGSKKYAPLAIFLAGDVVNTLVSNWEEQDKIDADLWKNVERYDLNSIKNADLEEMVEFQGPQHLRETVSGLIYESTWTLTENDGLKFGNTYYGYGNHRATCHTDLANGEPIISGGMAYFSEDKKTLLAIDNQTGHYQTSLESVFATLPIFEKSDINIDNTIISGFGCDEPQPFKNKIKNDTNVDITIVEKFGEDNTASVQLNRKTNDDVADRVNQMRAKSFPQLEPENRNSISPKFDK